MSIWHVTFFWEKREMKYATLNYHCFNSRHPMTHHVVSTFKSNTDVSIWIRTHSKSNCQKRNGKHYELPQLQGNSIRNIFFGDSGKTTLSAVWLTFPLDDGLTSFRV